MLLFCQTECRYKVLLVVIRFGEAQKVGANPDKTIPRISSLSESWYVYLISVHEAKV